VLIYLSVANEDSVLKGGMFLQGALQMDPGQPVLAIPAAAARDESGVAYVCVIDNGKIERRNVSLGLRAETTGMVEVRDGLREGEHVLTAPIDTIKGGETVVVHDEAAAAPAKAP
jgi:multidrug efflux pump subunit AcrA (membrane-fusion protein)